MVADADTVVWQLEQLQSDSELAKIRKRLGPDEAAIGIRMRDLFATAKAHTDLDLTEVDRLLDHPAYERGWRRCASSTSRLGDASTSRGVPRSLTPTSAGTTGSRHGTWWIEPPHVLGGHLTGRSMAPLHHLAASPEPLRRRSAVTAPLYFVITDDDEGVTAGFELAASLAGDPEPVVHNAVGIFLKHAGSRDPEALHRFLETQPRPCHGRRSASRRKSSTSRAGALPNLT